MDFFYPTNKRNLLVINHEVPVLSFFTGAGFLDIGFKRAGFKIVWTNEVDPVFIRNYQHGMQSLTASSDESNISASESLEDLPAATIISKAFNNTPKPDVFGVIGGPPCPDFSTGGKNRGGEGDRGRLLLTFVERISQIEPTFFLIENVPGLVKTEKHRSFLRDALSLLSDNYAISISMLNSLEFAVAQDRYRIFIAGFRRKWLIANSSLEIANNGIEWKYVIDQVNGTVPKGQGGCHQDELFPRGHWFPWPIDYRYIYAKTKYEWPINAPFQGTPEKRAGNPEELMVGPLICDQNKISILPNGTEGFKPHCGRFASIDEGDVSRKSFKRLHRWRFSPTAAYGNNEVHLHPTEPRRLTVREAFRIQSVPDNYAFPIETSLSSKFKMIGNGVPVRLAEAVGFSIAQALKGNFNQQLVLYDRDKE